VVHTNRLYLTVLATVKAPCNVSIGENVPSVSGTTKLRYS
jgi:hypothetical protein